MLLLSSSILIVIAVHDVFLACTQARTVAAAAAAVPVENYRCRRRRLNLHFPSVVRVPRFLRSGRRPERLLDFTCTRSAMLPVVAPRTGVGRKAGR